MRHLSLSPAAVRIILVIVVLVALPLTTGGDWPTYLHDTSRSSASLNETTLSTSNTNQLVRQWAFKTGGAIAASPTIVGGTVYVGSWDGYEYALDPTSGALKWKTYLGITGTFSNCYPQSAGVSSAAAVLNGVVYVGGGDSYWYALDATTGNVLWKVFTGDNSATGGHYNWSSPLIVGNFAYIGIASFGDCPLVQGQLLMVDLTSHAVVHTANFVPNGEVGGGIWTSPTYDAATNTIYVTTGTKSSSDQTMSQAIVALDASTLTIKSFWQIPTSQLVPDADWGTTPAVITDNTGNRLVVAANKNGFLYAFSQPVSATTAISLSAGPAWQDQIAVGGSNPTGGDGTVSSGAFDNSTFYQAGGRIVINGQGYGGSVQAIDPATGALHWQHPTASAVVPAIAYASGFVVDGEGSTVEVLDANNGNRLYLYTTGSTLYGAPSVANGQIFIGSTDGNVYAFGLPSSPTPTPVPDPNCPSSWSCQDIGSPTPAGSESVSSGTWTVTAGGTGLAGTADSFRLLAQTVSGNTQVTAQIPSLPAGANNAQAALIVRQSTDPAAAYYAVYLTGKGNLTVSYRTIAGGNATTVLQQTSTTPIYLQIQRIGDQFTAASSSNGVTYGLLPGTTATVTMPTSVLAGLAASSGANGTAGTATIAQVAVGAPGAPPATATPTTACPSGWSCSDIGNPSTAGGQSWNGGTWTVQGAGADITGTADQFHFDWQTLGGDGSVSTRVVSQTNTSPWAKAGVMLRAGTDSGSANYAAIVTPSNGILVQYRSSQGFGTNQLLTATGAVPAYLRVARAGTSFGAYTSGDGAAWTLLPGSTITLGGLSGSLLAGLAVTSHNAGALSTATFDSVTVAATGTPTATPSATNTATSTGTATSTSVPPTLTATPTASATATGTATPACPAGWGCADVGSVGAAGGESLNGGTWTVQGSGGDIWGTADAFHFDWQALGGDGSASARVISQTNTSPWAKAGAMLRAGTDPGAPFYDAVITPGNGVAVQYRASQGVTATQLLTATGAVPAYLRVARAGTSFGAYTSGDGATWTLLPGSTITLGGLSGSLLAGLAVTSHNAGALSTVTFDSVAVAATGTPTGTPTATSTSTATPTATATGTATSTPVPPTLTAAPTASATATGTPIATSTPTATATGTTASTNTPTATSSATPAPLTATGTPTGTPTATSTSTATPTATATGTASPSCPAGWGCADIGSVGAAGGQRLNAGTWTVQGAGADIYGSADAFHFDWQALNGDGGVSSHVLSQTNTSPWTKAGVMLRASTDPGAPFYAALVTPGKGFFVEYRKAQGGTVVRGTSAAGTVPIYLKVARSGSGYSAYSSSDGAAWTPLPGSSVALSLPSGLLAGLAVTSHSVGVLSTATFDTVTVG